MTTLNIDEKIIRYLNENSKQISPCTPIEIANDLKLPAEDILNRCQFLVQKKIIVEHGWGTTIENARFFTRTYQIHQS